MMLHITSYAFPDPTSGSPRQNTGTEEMTPREAGFHGFPFAGFHVFHLSALYLRVQASAILLMVPLKPLQSRTVTS